MTSTKIKYECLGGPDSREKEGLCHFASGDKALAEQHVEETGHIVDIVGTIQLKGVPSYKGMRR